MRLSKSKGAKMLGDRGSAKQPPWAHCERGDIGVRIREGGGWDVYILFVAFRKILELTSRLLGHGHTSVFSCSVSIFRNAKTFGRLKEHEGAQTAFFTANVVCFKLTLCPRESESTLAYFWSSFSSPTLATLAEKLSASTSDRCSLFILWVLRCCVVGVLCCNVWTLTESI